MDKEIIEIDKFALVCITERAARLETELAETKAKLQRECETSRFACTTCKVDYLVPIPYSYGSDSDCPRCELAATKEKLARADRLADAVSEFMNKAQPSQVVLEATKTENFSRMALSVWQAIKAYREVGDE